MPKWLDDLIEEIEGEQDESRLLSAIFNLQVDTYRRIERMADELQVQIDAAIAADAEAIKAIGVRVDAATEILTEKLKEASAAAPHLDMTHTIAALNDLKSLADGIAAAPAPAAPADPGPGATATATVSLDPVSGKPLYTRNDPQDLANGVWPVASVEGDGGQVLYTFQMDTGPTPTGDGADGGIWHVYTGATRAKAAA